MGAERIEVKDCLQGVGLVLLAASCLLAHDTWLVPAPIASGPAAFRVAPGQAVKVALNTSEDFPTSEGAATPDRIARFEMVTAAGRLEVSGYRVEEKSLVAEVTPGAGVTVVAAATHPRLIILKPEEFNTYISEERLEGIVAVRAVRGQSQADGRERYSKIAKVALCAGEAPDASYQQPFGFRVEIVPESNPCGLRVGDSLEVQVLFAGQPLPDVWVVAGYPGVHGHHYPLWARTNSQGRTAIPLDRRGPWFARVLHMVPSTEFPDADWQSWFSTFTFAVE